MIPDCPHCRPFDELPEFDVALPSPSMIALRLGKVRTWFLRFDVSSDLPNEPLLFRPVRVPDARLANAALASGDRKHTVVHGQYQNTILLPGREVEPDLVATKNSPRAVCWVLRHSVNGGIPVPADDHVRTFSVEWRNEDNRHAGDKFSKRVRTEPFQSYATTRFNKSVEMVPKRLEVENLMAVTFGVDK
jgi:hypothetical protein